MVAKVKKNCGFCGSAIEVRLSDHKRGWGKFCNKSCKAKQQERNTGQHKAYRNGRGVSNLHPERLRYYGRDHLDWSDYEDDNHPFSSESLGQW